MGLSVHTPGFAAASTANSDSPAAPLSSLSPAALSSPFARVLGNFPTAVWQVKSDLKLLLQATVASSMHRGMSKQDRAKVALDDILDRLPHLVSSTLVPGLENAGWQHPQTPASAQMFGVDPMARLLLSEVRIVNAAISLARHTLTALDFALQGRQVLSAESQQLVNELCNNVVPLQWLRTSAPSQLPLAEWVNLLIARAQQLVLWASHYPEHPPLLQLSLLCRPRALFSALIQLHSQRRKEWSVENVGVVAEVTHRLSGDAIATVPKDGIYVSGINLIGGEGNGGGL